MTKWRFLVLWAVLSLSLVNSTANIYESPSAGRPVRREKLFEPGATENNRKSAPARSFPSPTPVTPRFVSTDRPEAKIQSDFAYLPDVSVTCATSHFVVRVKTAFYGFGAKAEELKIGSGCRSNGVLRPYGDLLFNYPFTECDARREMPRGYLVYKFVLHYAPLPRLFPSRTRRIDVNIECRFQRYHHVHQLAVRPTWQTAIVHKTLKGGPSDFQIQQMDDSWTRPAKSQVYQLGQTVNFQVSTSHLPPGGKLYIRSCYATPSAGSESFLKYTIIDNFGCMLESQRGSEAAQFVSPRTDKTLRFSLAAFQFTYEPDTKVHIHCNLFVTSEVPSPSQKSCNYRKQRWKALTGDDSICECCDSQCMTSKPRRALMEGSASSGPLLVSDQPYTPEDSSLPVTSSLVSKTREGKLEDMMAFETEMNQQIHKLHSPENLWNNTDVVKYYDDDDEDQQNYTDLEEEEEKQFEEESRERKKSSVRDLEEFGEDGSGYIYINFLEIKEDELGSRSESERGELRAVEGREDKDSDERQLIQLRKTEEAEPPHGMGVEEMLASEMEGNSQLTGKLGKDKVQPLETQSKEEEKREKYTGTGEAETTMVSEIELKDDGVPHDGLVEAGIVGGEMTWYFTWR